MKPLLDILKKVEAKPEKKSVSFDLKHEAKSKKETLLSAVDHEARLLSKKEQREKNVERENTKSIQKQSIRFKKA